MLRPGQKPMRNIRYRRNEYATANPAAIAARIPPRFGPFSHDVLQIQRRSFKVAIIERAASGKQRRQGLRQDVCRRFSAGHRRNSGI